MLTSPLKSLHAEAHGFSPWASTALLTLALLLTACAAPPRSTRMTVDDFDAMAAAMAASLARSEAIAERGPDSKPWVIVIERVRNLSMDVMTQSEQWAVVARLRSAIPLQTLSHDRNVRFVMAPERVAAMRAEDPTEFDERFAADRLTPTHTMTATFRSIPRAYDRGRTDFYYCEFEILEHATGEPVWHDRFEYKRQAFGHLWD
ncbi:MAG: hypothetical protein WD534_00720 [Phycisphaeraceae bacterium]